MNKKLAPLRAKNDVTNALQLFEVVKTSYGRNKNLDKKNSRTRPDVHFKDFSLTIQQTKPKTD